MTDFDQLRADLERMREELTSKIHLGSKDAQARWAEFEKKWEQLPPKPSYVRAAKTLALRRAPSATS